MAGPGWVLVGDAASFVDPIISPGVQTALSQARLAAVAVETALVGPERWQEATAHYDLCGRRDYEAFAAAAANVYGSLGSSLPDAPPGARAEGGARLPFLSLVSGLPVPALLGSLAAHMGRRQQAAQRDGTAVVFGEEEGFAFLSRRFHEDRLRAGRADRVSGELADGAVVRLAPGVSDGEQPFLPAGEAPTLVRRRAVRNRFGDRFRASRELEALVALLPEGRTCAALRHAFAERLGTGREVGEAAFRDWLNLLADQGLVEW
jgi:hypothetical protein